MSSSSKDRIKQLTVAINQHIEKHNEVYLEGCLNATRLLLS
jgi:hypothetical protein